jgi:hypothetical protein
MSLTCTASQTHIMEYTYSRRPIELPSSPPLGPLSRINANDMPVFPNERVPLLNNERSSSPTPTMSTIVMSTPKASRTEIFLGMSYASFSGILSGMCLIFAKSGVELLMLTIGGQNQFGRWETWVLLIGLAVFALLQLWYLHKSLVLANPTLVCPCTSCSTCSHVRLLTVSSQWHSVGTTFRPSSTLSSTSTSFLFSQLARFCSCVLAWWSSSVVSGSSAHLEVVTEARAWTLARGTMRAMAKSSFVMITTRPVRKLAMKAGAFLWTSRTSTNRVHHPGHHPCRSLRPRVFRVNGRPCTPQPARAQRRSASRRSSRHQ